MAKKVKKQLVQRTRNGGTETESQHIGKIRSSLRMLSRFWKPIQQAKQNARRKYIGANKAQKWEYQCAECLLWFQEKLVQVDHLISCDSLKSYQDLPAFCERLFCEDVNGYAVKCKPCHQLHTNEEREAKKVK